MRYWQESIGLTRPRVRGAPPPPFAWRPTRSIQRPPRWRTGGRLAGNDLFSGCGGMSCGCTRRPPFRLVAAVDAEYAKPCEGPGRLDCNHTYAANIGIEPFDRNIAELDAEAFAAEVAAQMEPPCGGAS